MYMGLFNPNEYNEIENEILRIYSQMLMAHYQLSEAEAEKSVTDMLDKCVELSKSARTYDLPNNLGNIVVGDDNTTDSRISAIADFVKERLPDTEGVRKEDIREFWNLNDIERRILIEFDEHIRMAAMLELLSDGKTTDEATEKIFKSYPIYGDPNDTSKRTGDDRPLPPELKNRVNKYIENEAAKDPQRTKKE